MKEGGRKPTIIDAGAEGDCLLEFGNQNRVVALGEGESRTLTDESELCQIKLKVTRLGDSKQFKRFTIEAQ